MQSIRLQPENHIPAANLSALNDITAVHDTNDAAGEVVFALAINSGQLCCFTAEKSAARRSTGMRKAPQQLLKHTAFEFPAPNVVQEEKRTCAQDRDVVHAVVNQVGANRVMLVESKCDF